MTKINLCVLLTLSFGLLQTLASPPSIRLEIKSDSNVHCVNVTSSCTYGCDHFSTTTHTHILTPMCRSNKSLPEKAPQHLTIRGTTLKPYLLDQDTMQKYECNKTMLSDTNTDGGLQYKCTSYGKYINHSVIHSNASSGSSTMAEPTTTSIMPVSPCILNDAILAMGSGKGNEYDCCQSNDDCRGQCIRNACNAEKNVPVATLTIRGRQNSTYLSTIRSTVTVTYMAPTTSPVLCVNTYGVFGMANGNGNLKDCCQSDLDCHGSCQKNACNGEDNVPPPHKCTNTSFRGKKNGRGPKGVCCNTQADCLQSCVVNICTA